MKHENYEVGYGKPPKTGQFKKGVSGNPRGRPRKAENAAAGADGLWDQKILLTVGAKRKCLSRRKVLVLGIVDQIVKQHDLDAIAQLFEFRSRDMPKDQTVPIIIAEQEDGSYK